MILTAEQMEELGAALRGTCLSIEEGLQGLDMDMDDDEGDIEAALADDEETIRCDSCGKWVFLESMAYNAMGDLICTDCALAAMKDEEDEDE